MGGPVFVCLYLNLFNDFFQLDEKEEEEEEALGYSGSNVDGWMEGSFQEVRQTDRYHRRRRKRRRRCVYVQCRSWKAPAKKSKEERKKKDPNFWPGGAF
jgi:hypothetical protein